MTHLSTRSTVDSETDLSRGRRTLAGTTAVP